MNHYVYMLRFVSAEEGPVETFECLMCILFVSGLFGAAVRRTRCTARSGRGAPGVHRPAGDVVPRLGLGAAAAAALAAHADGATAAAPDGATVPAAAAPAPRTPADRLRKRLSGVSPRLVESERVEIADLCEILSIVRK